MKIYTGGTFDLFHAGHVELLKWLWQLGGGFKAYVTVGLNTDDFIESYKGKPPVNGYAERKAVLESCRYVTDVVENTGGSDSKPAIASVKPEVVAIGSDWHDKDYLAQMEFDWAWLDDNHIALLYIPRVRGHELSTTKIKERMASDDVCSDSGAPAPLERPSGVPSRFWSSA